MKTVVSSVASVVSALFLMGVSVGAPPAQPLSDVGPQTLDPDTPVRMELTLCRDEADRDCIEAIGVVTKDGFVPGAIVSTAPPTIIGPVEPGGSEVGPTTGQFIERNETWRLPGLRTESGQDTIDPSITITTPGMKWHNLDHSVVDVPARVEFELHTGRSIFVLAVPPCDPDWTTCPRSELIYPDQTLRAVIRTAWFQPSWARSHLGNTILKIDRQSGGGSRITVQGSALNSPGFFFGGGRNPNPSDRDQFDYYDYRWSAYLIDANDPNFPDRCAGRGFPLISGNNMGSAPPMWDSRTQSMDLVMSAPHLDGDGKAFRGHYEAFIPAAYARCLWQADPKRLQSRLIVEVTSEEGEEKAASTSIAFRDGGVRIVARNFTYSSPTITVRPKSKRS